MKKANFLTPVVTAFDVNGNLDLNANKYIYDFLIKAGVDGLVIMGSTGEFYSMTISQRKELINLAVNYVNKRTKVYIGTGCMSIEDTVELSNYAITSGADGVMIISPYYFSLSDESVEFFYDKVAEGVQGDIYLYNYPENTGHDLSPEITLNLLRKHNNIVGYKDTVAKMGHTRKLIKTVENEFPNFIIFSGFEENFAHNILGNGDGCIGGLSNLYPEIFVEWVKSIDSKNLERVSQIQNIVDKLMNLYDIKKPFIPILKKAMMLRGIELQDYCKSPLIRANEKETEAISFIIKEINQQISNLKSTSIQI